jgi:hypothetical protein
MRRRALAPDEPPRAALGTDLLRHPQPNAELAAPSPGLLELVPGGPDVRRDSRIAVDAGVGRPVFQDAAYVSSENRGVPVRVRVSRRPDLPASRRFLWCPAAGDGQRAWWMRAIRRSGSRPEDTGASWRQRVNRERWLRNDSASCPRTGSSAASASQRASLVRSFGDRGDANLMRAREHIVVVGRWAAVAAVGVPADETREEGCCWQAGHARPGRHRRDWLHMCVSETADRCLNCGELPMTVGDAAT